MQQNPKNFGQSFQSSFSSILCRTETFSNINKKVKLSLPIWRKLNVKVQYCELDIGKDRNALKISKV